MFIYQSIPYRRDDRRPVPPVNRKEERSDWRKEPSEKRTTDSSGPRRGPEDDRRRTDDRGRGDRNLGPRDDPPVRDSKCECYLHWPTVLLFGHKCREVTVNIVCDTWVINTHCIPAKLYYRGHTIIRVPFVIQIK